MLSHSKGAGFSSKKNSSGVLNGTPMLCANPLIKIRLRRKKNIYLSPQEKSLRLPGAHSFGLPAASPTYMQDFKSCGYHICDFKKVPYFTPPLYFSSAILNMVVFGFLFTSVAAATKA